MTTTMTAKLQEAERRVSQKKKCEICASEAVVLVIAAVGWIAFEIQRPLSNKDLGGPRLANWGLREKKKYKPKTL